MSTSDPQDRLLRPSLDILLQHSRKSNSSIESRSSYFSSVSSHAAISRRQSPFEGPPIASRLSAGLVSPSCPSDYGSEYSGESQYLTPPLSRGDNEKPPYKARSPSAASLNMIASQSDHITHSKHTHRAKKRHSKQNRRPLLEENDGRGQRSQEHECQSHQCLAGCQGRNLTSAESGAECERLGKFVKSTAGLNNIIKSPADIEGRSSNFFKTAGPNITTRRWSSVGIGADGLPRTSSVMADSMRVDLANDSHKRRNSWNHTHENDEIMSVVRARLTFREVPSIQVPTPAIITLRRASRIPADHSGASQRKPDSDVISSLPPQPPLCNETQPTASTYLITTEDIDFITNLIQSGFDIGRTTAGLSDCNNVAARKPTVTNQGVIPQSSIPADLATTITDVHQAPEVSRISFKDSRSSSSKMTTGGRKKMLRALSLQNVQEVIWEDTGSQRSQSTSSRTSSVSVGHVEFMDDSHAASLLGQSSSTNPEVSSSHAGSPGEHQRRSHDGGDSSPTSRVLQWVFKQPTGDMAKSLGSLPKQTVPDGIPEFPIAPGKRCSIPPISVFSPDVVSFPPLPARKFTSDWISPLPDMSAPASDDRKCLYDAGVDAQVGSGFKDLKSPLLHVNGQAAPAKSAEQHPNPTSPYSEFHKSKESTNLLHPLVSPRLGDPFKVGNALGCSSGARRKSSTQSARLRISDEALEHHFREDQTSWVKPRKDSGWPAPKSPSPEELDSRKSSHASPPPVMQTHGQVNKGMIKHEDRFDVIKGLTPLLPEADHSGIYAALTGTQAVKVDCGPNCQLKHACGNTPIDSRNPSTDWIG